MPEADYDAGGEMAVVDETTVVTGAGPAAQSAPPAKESRGGLFGRRRERLAKAEAAAPAVTRTEEPAEPAPTTASGGEAEPAVADDNGPTDGRHIVYIAAMQISVFNLDEAMDTAEALPEKYGGYIASMTDGHIVLRIPSKNLRKLMDEIGELGVVESRSLQAQDVTDEYYDVESRITALEKTHAQLLDLLGKARTVQEALEVRRALDEVAMELEVLKGRMRKLQNLISFSTLTLGLVERGPFTPTPSSNDPFPWVDNLGVEATEWK
jgi:chemotaxis protein histidine kinase CheA